MSYVITHPEKMDDARQQQWQKLAHLTDMDMNTINNLELLGVPVKKRGNTKSGLGLTFGRKRKRAVRKVIPTPSPPLPPPPLLVGAPLSLKPSWLGLAQPSWCNA